MLRHLTMHYSLYGVSVSFEMWNVHSRGAKYFRPVVGKWCCRLRGLKALVSESAT